MNAESESGHPQAPLETVTDIKELVEALEYCARLMDLDGRTGEVTETKEITNKYRAKYDL